MKNSLVKNSLFNVFYNILNTLFPLISVTYASHKLLDVGIGKVASAQNIVQYFVLLSAFGIPNYGIREIARRNDNKKNQNKLFLELLIINGISTLFFMILYYALINFSNMFESELLLYDFMGLLIVCNFINIDWYFQGTEQFQFIAIRNFLVKCFSIILLIIFVNDRNDYIKYSLINIFAVASNYLINICALKKQNIRLHVKCNIGLKKHFKSLVIFVLTSFSIELYTLLDTTMLTLFCGPQNVAYYNNTNKLVRLLITVVVSIGGVLLPRLSMHYAKDEYEKCNEIVNKVFEIMFFILLPCGIGLVLISDKLVPVLFGNSFIPAITTMKIAALLIYTLGLSNLFGTQVLLTFGKEKKLLFCTILGAISNVFINLLLIPRYQQNGAVIASVISEGIVTVAAFIYAIEYIKFNPRKKNMLVSIVSSLCMCIVVICINQYIYSNVLKLMIDIISAIVIYMGVNAIMRNPIIIDLKDLIYIYRENK